MKDEAAIKKVTDKVLFEKLQPALQYGLSTYDSRSPNYIDREKEPGWSNPIDKIRIKLDKWWAKKRKQLFGW